VTRTALAGCLAFILCALAAAPAHAQNPPDASFAPGEVVVRFKPSVGAAERREVRRANDATVADVLTLPGVHVLEIGEERSVPAAAAALERERGVAYAEPNWIYEVDAIPADPRFGDLWGLHNTGQSVAGVSGVSDADIDAHEAWDVTTGDPDVVVAVVDTGVAHQHPDIADSMWANPGESGGTAGFDDDGNGFIDDVRGWDFYGDGIEGNTLGDREPLDFNGHGTHVAATVAAGRNDTEAERAVVGVAPDTKLMALRVCNGAGACRSSAIADAFEYAGDEGAAVVNASLGGPSRSAVMLQAIRAHPDTLYVAAAGNDGDDLESAPQFPCELDAPNMVCVAATGQADELAGFSNFGRTAVDLAAPGTRILSAQPVWDALTPLDEFETFDNWNNGDDDPDGTWGVELSYANQTNWILSDSPVDEDYPNGTSNRVYRDAVNLSTRKGCALDFLYRVRKPDVGSDQDRLEAGGGATIADFTVLEEFGEAFSSDFFDDARVDVSAFDGVATFRPGFRWVSDASGNGDGGHVDRFQVLCLGTAFGPGQFDFLQGTSFAAPHVSGAAALARARHPEATGEQLRRLLIETVDPKPGLANRTLSGGRLNAHSAVTAPLPALASPSGSGEPPGTEPPSLGEPGPPPAGTPDDRIALAATSFRVTRGGLAAVPVECRSSRSSCLGTIVLRTAHRVRARSARRSRRLRLGGRDFSLAAGTRRVVNVRISRKGRRLLDRKRRLRVRVTLSLRAGAAAPLPEVSTAVLLAPRR
jgi:thermitase